MATEDTREIGGYGGSRPRREDGRRGKPGAGAMAGGMELADACGKGAKKPRNSKRNAWGERGDHGKLTTAKIGGGDEARTADHGEQRTAAFCEDRRPRVSD